MATHMVPQDVEAEDKLVGFLSLKQFIMTVVGIGFGYLTFFFFTKVHPVAALLWLPPTILFLVLGVYQRKDQPVEVFLASALTFYFKPRKRKWDQEGHEDHVIITAPEVIEHHYTKDFTGEEAASRLQSLSTMMDSRGWASKQWGDWQNPQLATAAVSDNRLVQPSEAPGQNSLQQIYTQPADIMDESTSLMARDFANKITQTDNTMRTHAIQTIEQARNEPISPTSQATSLALPKSGSDEGITLPTKHHSDIHQRVVKPLEENNATTDIVPAVSVTTEAKSSAKTVSRKTSRTDLKSETPKEHVTEDGSVEISLH